MTTADAELLADLAEADTAKAQAALPALAARYVDLVYHTARRMVGDAQLAEDVTQAAFLVLMQKAHRIDPRYLAGWLVNTTRLAAREALRARSTRHHHERRAAAIRPEVTEPHPTADALRPLLDEALSNLSEADRTAVALRFLQGRSFADAGAAMAITEEAARKRVTRAVEKLRGIFTRQGILPTAGGLMLILAAEQAKAAPPAVIAAVSSPAHATPAAVQYAKGLKMTVVTPVLKLLACAAAAAMLFVGITPMRGKAPVPHAVASQPATRPFEFIDLAIEAQKAMTVDCPSSSKYSFNAYPPFGKQWDDLERKAYAADQPVMEIVRRMRTAGFTDDPEIVPQGEYEAAIQQIANHVGDAALYEHARGEDASALERITDLVAIVDQLERGEHPGGTRMVIACGVRALAMDRLMIVASDLKIAPPLNEGETDRDQPEASRHVIVDLIKRLIDRPDVNRYFVPDYIDWTLFQQDINNGRIREDFNRCNGEQAMAAISLAAHLFEHDKHRWPASLEELVPTYLPSVPLDPWGNGKQTYGYLLVKAGLPDGKDRPLAFSRASFRKYAGGDVGLPATAGPMFFRVDVPNYEWDKGISLTPDAKYHDYEGQFRDIAHWVPGPNTSKMPTTRPAFP